MLYAGMFFLAGIVLIGLMYLYFRQSLTQHVSRRAEITEQLTADALAGQGSIDQLHHALGAQFRQERDQTLRAMVGWSLASLALLILAATGLGWLLAGRALRPLRRITATARRVADRSLHERIALAGPDDEIKDLADTFDAMLERLDRSFDGQRCFVANVSHELRTPLTINRALLQVALDSPDTPPATRELGTTLLEVNQRQERLIDGLLVLATSDQPLTETRPVDLADIALRVTEHARTATQEAGVAVHLSTGTAPVLGDPVLLERLAHNLLDNAIRYNHRHGWVGVETGAADERAHLTIENTGPIVPADEVNGLFEPFRRLDSTAPGQGAGLGLSIVRSVAHAHHGEVRAHPRPDGGLAIHVHLPTALSTAAGT